jgi:hypothetical protein
MRAKPRFRTLFRCLIASFLITLLGPVRGQARVLCATPDRDTFATDSPPPGCEERNPPPAPLAEEPRETETTESRRLHAISICEQTIAGQLEGAGSVNWPARDRYRVQERGGAYDVEGYVEAQGPLGDVRKSWSCHATGSGGHWSASAMLGNEEKAAGAPRPAAEATASMPPPRSAAANVGSCRSARFRDTYSERYNERGYQIVKGKIENSGSQPIRNVKVCASGLCTVVHDEPPLAPGSTKDFAIQVPSLEVVTVTAQCSVAEPM